MQTFTCALNKLKTRYLHQRQAPQEILEPNEINEEEMNEDEGESAAKKAALVPKVIGNPEGSESDQDGEEEEK